MNIGEFIWYYTYDNDRENGIVGYDAINQSFGGSKMLELG